MTALLMLSHSISASSTFEVITVSTLHKLLAYLLT